MAGVSRSKCCLVYGAWGFDVVHPFPPSNPTAHGFGRMQYILLWTVTAEEGDGYISE